MTTNWPNIRPFQFKVPVSYRISDNLIPLAGRIPKMDLDKLNKGIVFLPSDLESYR
jgi:hypothetical protein